MVQRTHTPEQSEWRIDLRKMNLAQREVARTRARIIGDDIMKIHQRSDVWRTLKDGVLTVYCRPPIQELFGRAAQLEQASRHYIVEGGRSVDPKKFQPR